MTNLSAGKTSILTVSATLVVSALLLVNQFTSVALAGNPHNSPTPTPTATPNSVSVNVCHKDGQSGNYSKITVSVHSVNDANGLNGHGNHNGDVWAPFTYNNVNYSGHGNYSSFNFSNCTQPSPTPTPTEEPCDPTATPSATPTATPVATATPTVVPTSTPVVTNNDHGYDGGDGKGCAVNDCSGNAVQGQVLGASTMAATGTFDETLYQAIMTLGATLTAFGVKGLKKAKKSSKK